MLCDVQSCPCAPFGLLSAFLLSDLPACLPAQHKFDRSLCLLADDFQLLPPRHTLQHHALPIQRSRPQSVAAGSARVAQHATAKPRHRSGYTHQHRQSRKPSNDTGQAPSLIDHSPPHTIMVSPKPEQLH